MIFQNVELHNIDEVREVDGHGGVRMQRVPESVRVALNPKAQMQMLRPACAEVRMVSEGPVRVTLSSEGGTEVIVAHGAFLTGQRVSIGTEPQTIEIAPHERLTQLPAECGGGAMFSPRVFRILLRGASTYFHGAEGEGVRPPAAEELPKRRYLAYGTSITHGAAATGPHLTYVGQTARRLGADLINLGVGGACHAEPALADYMAARTDWDFASLALSVNMIGAGFTPDEFYERVSYMVNTVAGADTSRPVACITIYPHIRDFVPSAGGPNCKAAPDVFRQKLRDAVAACPHENAHLIEGPDILTDVTGLTPDLVHPNDHGMILMGENLAYRLEALL